MNRRAIVVIVVLATFGPACGREREAGATQSVRPADGAIHLSPDQVRASDIRSADVVERTVAPSIAVIGRVKARAGGEADVLSPFPGSLVGDGLPKIGDTVTKGQRIAEVEQQFTAADMLQVSTTAIGLRTSVEQAQQDLQLKHTELNRAQPLYEGGAIPQKQLQTAEFDVKQAEAKLEGARRAKEQYEAAVSTTNSGPRRAPIVAPISGTVVAAEATVGQQVDPSKNLFTIADLRTVWVEAAVPEQDLAPIRAARSAEIAIPGSPGSLTGALVTIGNLVDPQNRTVPATFNVDNRAGALKIEMLVEVRIPTGPQSTVLMIPASAVLAEAGASYVYVEARPGVYARKVVALGDRKDDAIVVTSGLTKGERVVTVGAGSLRGESLKTEIPADADEKDKKSEKD
ncbi:MAG: efflux RND transporter periplasmic adaptor subunit [Acidobacteria bacterium]|nr:efflux RND transporter periplasmic adaptor subunit [Acidobacteriota bacterium]